ncbi:unnamed protein product [Rangifer tarandus platyrhynchus]|uniref:Uncharacterized protein n=2 Tax=Rangifer tarandus platyrhynchus TaxID=3082113 RepID=A0ABN8YW04_RANTA|nr:unnamed protein product [Rangifer tarandus platyrhynchus]CAI9693709.1 unnamed protein product [Rangifer tarandus platyrhynchus]
MGPSPRRSNEPEAGIPAPKCASQSLRPRMPQALSLGVPLPSPPPVMKPRTLTPCSDLPSEPQGLALNGMRSPPQAHSSLPGSQCSPSL